MMPALLKRVTAAVVTVLPFAVQALKHHEYRQTSLKTLRLMLKKNMFSYSVYSLVVSHCFVRNETISSRTKVPLGICHGDCLN